MKKFLLVIALCSTALTQALDQSTNQTFMFPKEIFGSFGMEQASWQNIVYNKNSHGVALQGYVYGQTSIPIETGSQYFAFNYLNQMIVQNDPTNTTYNEETFTRNILGAWLGIDGSQSFTGSYSLTPRQTQVGATIMFSQDLSKYLDVAYLRNSAFHLSLPIVYVKNQMVFHGDQQILSALQGANWSSMGMSEPWQYLILNNEVQETTALTNMKIQFSSKYESDDDVQVATTTFLIFPFVEAVSNEILLQPVVGYNGHIVWGSGITFQFPLLRSEDRLSRICFFTGLENKLLFANNQYRTFEIRDKPYSRYMPLYDRFTKTIVPGVNAFTKNCQIQPYNFVNFIAGFRYKRDQSIAEIGYELWGHDTETITILDNNLWQENRYGIANIDGLGQLNDEVQTASKSTINYVVPDTTETGNVYIKAKDLNFLPAVARATIVNRAYMSIGFGKKTTSTDIFLNLGLFLEVVQNNAAFSNWGGWLKAGGTF